MFNLLLGCSVPLYLKVLFKTAGDEEVAKRLTLDDMLHDGSYIITNTNVIGPVKPGQIPSSERDIAYTDHRKDKRTIDVHHIVTTQVKET